MKYELANETKTVGNVTLHRIKALKSFDSVEKGDLGGWIERESNLSQEDNAWVSGDARVSGNARVYGDAWVFGNAQVSGDARVYETEEPVNLPKSDTLSIGGKKYRLVEVED